MSTKVPSYINHTNNDGVNKKTVRMAPVTATVTMPSPVVYLQVMPKPNQKDDTKVDVDVMVKERPMKTADVDLSWGLAPNAHGIPLPADKFPGGSLTFENRNLGRQGNQFSASITSENFLQPNDDVGFKVILHTPGSGIQMVTITLVNTDGGFEDLTRCMCNGVEICVLVLRCSSAAEVQHVCL